MTIVRPVAVLSILVALTLGGVPAVSMAADGAAPTPATGGGASGAAADPAAPAAPTAKIAFGIITLAADKHSLTMNDAKGNPLTLKITAKTEITRDLKTVDLSGIAIDKSVRVTYTGDVATAIDQLSPDKKKKKKNA